MEIDLQVLNDAYISLAGDFVGKLKEKRSKDKIEIIKKKCKFC